MQHFCFPPANLVYFYQLSLSFHSSDQEPLNEEKSDPWGSRKVLLLKEGFSAHDKIGHLSKRPTDMDYLVKKESK